VDDKKPENPHVAEAFGNGSYDFVVQHLQHRARTARENAMLGISLLRTGQLADAEYPLLRASILGDKEGTVEYGNVLRTLGRFDEAIQHFETVYPELHDHELKLRATRWWGVAQFQAGDTAEGLKKVELAWHGYVALQDHELSARVSQSLAQMYAILGNVNRAKRLLEEAIHVLPEEPDGVPRLSALHNLTTLHIRDGEFDAARATIEQAKRTLAKNHAPRAQAMLLADEADLARLTGDVATYTFTLQHLLPLADQIGDYELRVWTTSRLAEQYARMEQHGKAVETLYGYGTAPSEWPAVLWATDGNLKRYRADYTGAITSYEEAVSRLREHNNVLDLARVLLQQAACELRLGLRDHAVSILKEALTHMLRLRHLHALKPDMDELSELTYYAQLEPETAPYMEPLLDQLAHLAGSARLPEDGSMHLQVTTLGRVTVYKDGHDIKFKHPHSPLVLVYIALNPGHTIAELQLELFPDKDPEAGRGYVRQCLWDIRHKLTPDVLAHDGTARGQHYRLGRNVQFDLDYTFLMDAINRGEVARALALYRGEFMPQGDAKSSKRDIEGPCDWVLEKREQARLALTFELHTQLVRARHDGDLRRVVLFANQVLRIDPLNIDVHRERVEAAKVVSPPGELAKYIAELNRASN